MRSMKIWIFVLLILALTAGISFAFEIEGSYRVEQDGTLIGAEKFSVQFNKDGTTKTTSTGTIHQDETSTENLTEVNYRDNGEIKDYQREIYVNRVPRKLIGLNQGEDLLIQINTGAQQIERKIPIHTSTMILDVGIFHHYNVLLHRYKARGGGKQDFWAAVPAEAREMKVTVEMIKHEAVQTEGGYFEGDKYFINLGDVGVIAWMDERDRIFKLEIPMQGVKVMLKDYKGKRAEKAEESEVVFRRTHREDVAFKSADGVKLAGCITRPVKLEGPLPALVFASTTGPQDRDGINTVANIPTHTNDILDYISEQGYLVLRYDDRGVGDSDGDFAKNALSKQAQEIQGALDFLKSRKDVDPKRLAVIGMGEGANAALQLAAKRDDLKALVLLAPSSISLSQLAVQQIKTRLAEQGNRDPDAYKFSPIFQLIRISRDSKESFHVMGGRPVYLDVFREWDQMDPITEIGKVKAKILHLQGGNDQQVFPDVANGLRQAPKKADYTFKQFDGLDHFFVKSSGSIGEYVRPGRKVDQDFLSYLVGWLASNL